MDLRQMEYVVAVVDHGGFTRAADALLVAQPSLSQGVRTLEAELGVALFHRLGRRVQLTSAGEALLEPARRMLRDAATARAAVAEVAGVVAGRLDLAALPTLAVDPLAPLVGAFRSAHPGVAVHVAEPEEGAAVDDLVRNGRVEVGLSDLTAPAAGRDGRGDLVTEALLDQDILAVCPPGTPVPGGELPVVQLAGAPLVTTPPGTSTRRLVDAALATAGITATVAVEISHREAIVPLVLAGAGTSFLPEPLAAEAGRQGAVVARLNPPLARTIGLVQRDGPLSPAARAFAELARQRAGSTSSR
jgi:DNA-binding transcriptional LysR family regulator